MKRGSILVLILFIGCLLCKNGDNYFGPSADDFYNFSYKEETPRSEEIGSTDMSISNISSRLYAKNNMYNLEIDIINLSDSIEKIITFDKNIPATKNLFTGTNIYPRLSVLSNTYSPLWLDLRISFIDIDGHEKYHIETIKIDHSKRIVDKDLVVIVSGAVVIALILFRFRLSRRNK